MHEVYKLAAGKYPELIPEPYRVIYDLYGYDAVVMLTELFGGGATVYIPQLRGIFAKCVEQAAREDYYSGMTFSKLINRYGLSERHLRRAVKGF